jgi:hypothetical protein
MTPISGYMRMMEHTGLSPVRYFFSHVTYLDEENGKKPEKCEATEHKSKFSINDLIGQKLRLKSDGRIRCTECGRPTKKSFGQGSCYVCFTNKAQNDMCIMKPETCHHHLGTCREPEWGERNCFKKHLVYFANSSGLKVGITKENPASKRWVDQGARFAIPVLEVDSRYGAGTLEHYLAKFLPDKTSWQKMVQGDPPEVDLLREKDKFVKHLSTQVFSLNTSPAKSKPLTYQLSEVRAVTEIQYPIQAYPKKIKSYKLSETDFIEDTLQGIKGQYLLFKGGVINLRSYGGYQFELSMI